MPKYRTRARGRFPFGMAARMAMRGASALMRRRRTLKRTLGVRSRRRVIKGRGAYSYDSRLMKSQENAVPMMHSNSQSIVVRHREFITSIYSVDPTRTRYVGTPKVGAAGGEKCKLVAATYGNSIQSFRINPGVGITQNLNPSAAVTNTADNVPVQGMLNAQSVNASLSYGAGQLTGALAPVVPQQNFQLQGCFPWLYKIAQQFEQYRIKGLVFEYVPSSADTSAGTTISTGTVDFYIEYNTAGPIAPGAVIVDPTDNTRFKYGPNFSGTGNDQQQTLLLNNMWAQSGKPCDAITIPYEADKRAHSTDLFYIAPTVAGVTQKPLIEPSGVTQQGSDMRMYDAGTLYVCAHGQSADNVLLGQLWVTYEIELVKPQLNVRLLSIIYCILFNGCVYSLCNRYLITKLSCYKQRTQNCVYV